MHRRNLKSKRLTKKRPVTVPTVKSVVKSVLYQQSEQKHLFGGAGQTYSSLTPDSFFVNLSAIPVGNTDISRVGDSVQPLSLELNLGGGVVNNQQCVVRLLVFQWYSVNSPSIAEILTQSIGGQDLTMSCISPDALKAKKFRVITDRRYVLSTNSNFKLCKPIHLKLNRLRKIGYMGGSTTASGNIYMWLISDAPTAAPANWPYVTYNYLIKFSDM